MSRKCSIQHNQCPNLYNVIFKWRIHPSPFIVPYDTNKNVCYCNLNSFSILYSEFPWKNAVLSREKSRFPTTPFLVCFSEAHKCQYCFVIWDFLSLCGTFSFIFWCNHPYFSHFSVKFEKNWVNLYPFCFCRSCLCTLGTHNSNFIVAWCRNTWF